MKRLFLLITLISILTTTSYSQWWVSGGNLLWPYGDVTINKNLNVVGSVNGAKSYILLFSHDGSTDDPTVIDLFNNIGSNSAWVRVSTGLYRTIFTDVTFDNTKAFNTRSVGLDNGDTQFHYFTYTSGSDLYIQVNNFGDLTAYDPVIDLLPISLIYYP
jgi:hypothetical protein